MTATANLALYATLPSLEGMNGAALDELVVSYAVGPDGSINVLSRYGDPKWNLAPWYPNANKKRAEKILHWERLPSHWRDSIKNAVGQYWRVGRPGKPRPGPGSLVATYYALHSFAHWLDAIGVHRFRDAIPGHCSQYVAACRNRGLRASTLPRMFLTVELLYQLRHLLADPLPCHPWPEASAILLAGASVRGPRIGKTEIIPIDHAAAWFQSAVQTMEGATRLLDARDALDMIEQEATGSTQEAIRKRKNAYLTQHRLPDLREFDGHLLDLRAAAYVVLAMGSGCRHHELAELECGAVYSSEWDAETYYWLKATTRKIGDGPREWLVPRVAQQAAHVLERWSAPLRVRLAAELETRRAECEALPTGDPAKATLAVEVQRIDADKQRLFLGGSSRPNKRVTVLSNQGQAEDLARYAGRHRLDYVPTTHQFRRTCASMLAHMRKGVRVDLVRLRDHFGHVSLDMTALYAANPKLDSKFYETLEREDRNLNIDIVAHWLEQDVQLSGGHAGSIKAYRKNHEVTTLKDRQTLATKISENVTIRATGHSWCLAEGNDCGGQGLYEATRCHDCQNSVIDDSQKAVWRGIWMQQCELMQLDDIGPGGKARVQRDLARATKVLQDLGVHTTSLAAP